MTKAQLLLPPPHIIKVGAKKATLTPKEYSALLASGKMAYKMLHGDPTVDEEDMDILKSAIIKFNKMSK